MKHISKFRPQVFLIIGVLGILAAFGLAWNHIEVATACVAAIAALGPKLIERD